MERAYTCSTLAQSLTVLIVAVMSWPRRYDNGCDRAVTSGCVGVIQWEKGAGRPGSRDLGLNDEPVPMKDPNVENVHQEEPYEEVQEVLPTESVSKATADAVSGSRLRAVTNRHVAHSPAPAGDDSKFWEGLGRSSPPTPVESWRANGRSSLPDPDAPTVEEAAKDTPRRIRRATSDEAERKREKMIVQVQDDVQKIFSKQHGPARRKTSSRASERGRQGGHPVLHALERVAKRWIPAHISFVHKQRL